jgi:hypothetical protein
MWAVVLKILIVLGWILLGILGLVLLLLLLVLFTPFVYRIEGAAGEEGSKDPYHGRLRLHWLLWIVTGGLDYPSPGVLKVRLFGIPIFKLDLGKEEDGADTEKDAVDEKDHKAEKEDEASSAGNGPTQADAGSVEEEKTDGSEQESGAENPEGDVPADSDEDDSEEDIFEDGNTSDAAKEDGSDTGASGKEAGAEDDAAADGEKDGAQEKQSIFEKIANTFHNFCDKIKLMLWDLEFWKNLLDHEDTRGFLASSKKQVLRVLRMILPRDIKADLIFGTGSPDTTGYLFGLYALFADRFRKGSRVIPDFEEKVIKGKVKMRGHFTVFGVALCGLIVILDKRLKRTRGRIASHKERKAKRLEKLETGSSEE